MISETGERQYKNWDRKKVALKTVRSSKVFSSSHFSFIHILEHFVLVVRLEQLVWHTHHEIHEITFELYRCIHGENLVEIQITFLRQFSLVRWYWLVWRRYIRWCCHGMSKRREQREAADGKVKEKQHRKFSILKLSNEIWCSSKWKILATLAGHFSS